jgi:hypothetical protein
VAGLDGVVGATLGVHDTVAALLAPGPQVKVVLEQLTDQRPTVLVEAGLQLLVGQTGGIGAAQEVDQAAVERVGGREGPRQLRRLSRLTSISRPALPCASSVSRASR